MKARKFSSSGGMAGSTTDANALTEQGEEAPPHSASLRSDKANAQQPNNCYHFDDSSSVTGGDHVTFATARETASTLRHSTRSPGGHLDDIYADSSKQQHDAMRGSNPTHADDSITRTMSRSSIEPDPPDAKFGGGSQQSLKSIPSNLAIDGAAAPNASATAAASVSAAAVVNAFLSIDEEEIDDLPQMEAKIETLYRVVEDKQRAIEECSYRLSGLYLGQDRYHRNYYMLGHFGGVYIQGCETSIDPSYEKPIESDDEPKAGTNEPAVNGDTHPPLDSASTDKREPSLAEDSGKNRVGTVWDFDADQMVAQIQARRQLAEKRKYKINIPTNNAHAHAIIHHANSNTNTKPADEVATKDASSGGDVMHSAESNTTTMEGGVEQSGDTESVPLPTSSCANESKSLTVPTYSHDHLPESRPLETVASANLEPTEQRSVTPVQRQGALFRLVSEMDGQDFDTKPLDAVAQPQDNENEDNNKTLRGTFEGDVCNNEPSKLPSISDATISGDELAKACHDVTTVGGGRKTEDSSFGSIERAATPNQIHLQQPTGDECDAANLIERVTRTVTSSGKRDTDRDHTATLTNFHLTDVDIKPNHIVESTTSPDDHMKMDSTANNQPLDLSNKLSHNTTSKNGQPSNSKFSDDSSLMIPSTKDYSETLVTLNKLGLDDVVLTTAALLFMTHTFIIPASVACSETLFEPWKSVIAHYKSLLIWALMTEMRAEGAVPDGANGSNCNDPNDAPSGGSDKASNELDNSIFHVPSTLRDAILLLKKSFMDDSKAQDPTQIPGEACPGQSVATDGPAASEIIPDIPVRDIENAANTELENRGIQVPLDRVQLRESIKSDSPNWWRLTDSSAFQELLHALVPRGIRERNLMKGIKRVEELLEASLQKACSIGRLNIGAPCDISLLFFLHCH